MYLRHASMLLKPKVEGQKAYTEEEVKTCLLALRDGIFRTGTPFAAVYSLLFVTYGIPPYIERLKDIEKYIPTKPPIYEKTALREWEAKYSKYLSKE